MPFVFVNGVPKSANKTTLVILRQEIVNTLAQKMGSPANWIRTYFPVDMLDEPELEADGARTIYVQLHTAMFATKPDTDALAKDVAYALAELVWNSFRGRYEVECFVVALNPEQKCLISALPDSAFD